MTDTDEIRLRPACGDVSNATHVIHGHSHPAIGAVIFGAIPGLVTELARMGHGMKSPEMFAGDDVETPDILFESGHDYDVLECRGTGSRCAKVALHLTGQHGVAVFAE